MKKVLFLGLVFTSLHLPNNYCAQLQEATKRKVILINQSLQPVEYSISDSLIRIQVLLQLKPKERKEIELVGPAKIFFYGNGKQSAYEIGIPENITTKGIITLRKDLSITAQDIPVKKVNLN